MAKVKAKAKGEGEGEVEDEGECEGEGESEGESEGEGEGEGEAAIDPFLAPCCWSLFSVVCDVISDAAAGGGLDGCFLSQVLLGSSIADDVSHDTKKGSIARAQEGINSKGNIIDIILHLTPIGHNYQYESIWMTFISKQQAKKGSSSKGPRRHK